MLSSLAKQLNIKVSSPGQSKKQGGRRSRAESARSMLFPCFPSSKILARNPCVQNNKATTLRGGEVDNPLLQLQRSIFA
ncbi:hypothetical protein V6N11_017465 [Hibiscus sabdariffa]|uniref:Uncharacterized protein n=1 Tax=Hibiscus sabdariffa TaxID=183260 RepID=A0ABR2TY38_9ROSI